MADSIRELMVQVGFDVDTTPLSELKDGISQATQFSVDLDSAIQKVATTYDTLTNSTTSATDIFSLFSELASGFSNNNDFLQFIVVATEELDKWTTALQEANQDNEQLIDTQLNWKEILSDNIQQLSEQYKAFQEGNDVLKENNDVAEETNNIVTDATESHSELAQVLTMLTASVQALIESNSGLASSLINVRGQLDSTTSEIKKNTLETKNNTDEHVRNTTQLSAVSQMFEKFSVTLSGMSPVLSQITKATGVPIQQFGSMADSIAKVIAKYKIFGLVAAIPAGIAGIATYAKEFKKYDRQLGYYVNSEKERLDVEQKLFDIAENTGDSFAQSVNYFKQLKTATGAITQDSDKILKFQKSLQDSFDVDRLDAGQAQGAMRMLSMMMSMPRISGRMMNNLLRTAPRAAKAIADSMGTTIGGLRQLANQKGGLTGQQIFDAMLESSDKLAQEANKTPKTWGKAMNLLHDTIMQKMADLDREFDFTGKIKGIQSTIYNMVKRICVFIQSLPLDTIYMSLKTIAIIISAIALQHMGSWLASTRLLAPALHKVVAYMRLLHMQHLKGNALETLLSATDVLGPRIKALSASATAAGGAVKGWALGLKAAAAGGETVTPFMAIFKYLGKSAGGGILGILKGIGGALLSVGKIFVSVFGWPLIILTAVCVLLEDVWTWIQGGESIIGDLLGPFNQLWDSIGFGSEIFQTLSDIFWAVVNRIAYNLGFMFGLFIGIWRRLKKLWNNLSEWASTAMDTIISKAQELLGTWKEIIKTVNEYLNKAGKRAENGLQTADQILERIQQGGSIVVNNNVTANGVTTQTTQTFPISGNSAEVNVGDSVDVTEKK